ncbi:MAG: ABC transporter permease subunit [Alphaproteobacteria bacterium]|nr:ABC transporter permease subunit [Alphaproteobacteria bacterium]
MKLKTLSSIFLGSKKKLVELAQHNNSKFWLEIVPLLWIITFFILPLLTVFKISFAESVFGIPPFTEIFTVMKNYMFEIKLSLKNYITMFRDPYYVTAFINSLYLSVVSTILCFLIGFPMAYGIHRVRDRLKTIFLLLVSLSFWTSFLIRIYSWMSLLSVNGMINTALIKLGIISSPIQFIGTYFAVALGLVFCYLPFMIFPIYAVLEKVDKSYIESAYDLGCRPTKTFWRITVPLAKSGIISGSVLVFSATIGEFVVPELMGGADSITFGRVLWNEFFTNLDWSMSCALSIGMMLIITIPIFMVRKSEII